LVFFNISLSFFWGEFEVVVFNLGYGTSTFARRACSAAVQKNSAEKSGIKICFTSPTNIFHIADNIPARRNKNGRHAWRAGRPSMQCGDA